MAVETAVYLSGLVPAQPTGTSVVSEGQGHIRVIKSTLQNSLPNVNEAVNAIHTRATAPTSKTPGTVWFDTSADVLKIWNEADSAWITLSVNPAANYGSVGTQAFYATASSGTSIPSSSETLVNFASETFDLDGTYDTSTSKWTPASGYYMIYAQVTMACEPELDNEDKSLIPSLRKNGSKLYEGMNFPLMKSTGQTQSATLSALVNSNGTDFWQIYLYQNTGSTNTTSSGDTMRFMGVRIA